VSARWVLLAAVMVAAGCAPVDRPVLVPDAGGSGVAPLGPAADPAVPEVRAVLTSTGIPVAVLGQVADGYLVRTPCGAEATVAWGTPLLGADVVLDPGHGGPVETGAVGPNGVVEAQVNLEVARAAATELTRRGVTVVLTRTGDYQVPLSVRAELAGRLAAQALVSIHHNAPDAAPSDRPGTEVYVQDGVDASRRLGGLVWQHVVAALERFDVAWTAAPDAGVLVVRKDTGEESYGMIRYPEVPAVVAELAYLSNPPEAELLATPVYRAAVGQALADAIEGWLHTDAQGSGYVDQVRTFTPSGLTGGTASCVDPILE
jgi:N-acetylmuramoyl-L-alanine amidase